MSVKEHLEQQLRALLAPKQFSLQQEIWNAQLQLTNWESVLVVMNEQLLSSGPYTIRDIESAYACREAIYHWRAEIERLVGEYEKI